MVYCLTSIPKYFIQKETLPVKGCMSVLVEFEQGEIIIVSHPLCHLILVFTVSFVRPSRVVRQSRGIEDIS